MTGQAAVKNSDRGSESASTCAAAPRSGRGELIGFGASRALPDSAGKAAVDVARERRYDTLVPALESVVRNAAPVEDLSVLGRLLAGLVEERIRPQLSVQLRACPTAILTELELGASAWFPIPGMYGGFEIRLETAYLDVKRWSRVVRGSGQAYVITAEGVTLVSEGFV